MKIGTYFSVRELVHPDILSKLGEKRAANTISDYLLLELERIRDMFGAVYINGGTYKNSGLRKASFYKRWGIQYESYSTHQYGNTADLKFGNSIKPSEVYDYILKHQDHFPYIVRMENARQTKTWLHIECGKYREDKIEVFNK